MDDLIFFYNGLIWGGIEYYIFVVVIYSYWVNYNNCYLIVSMIIVSLNVEWYIWFMELGCVYVEELKVIGGGYDWFGSFGNMMIDVNEEIW